MKKTVIPSREYLEELTELMSVLVRTPKLLICNKGERTMTTQKLEDTYKVANSITKANKQVDLASSMNVEEAIDFLRGL